MTASLLAAAVFCAFAMLLVFAGAASAADPFTPQGQATIKVLDAMGVESKWLAGEHVYWDIGLPAGLPEGSPSKPTHCSAFVAAKNFGVYILRPPEHGQKLLANAQNEWLAGEGAASGWIKLANAAEAQAAANCGLLVVASYHNHHDDRPGHGTDRCGRAGRHPGRVRQSKVGHSARGLRWSSRRIARP